MNQIKDLFINVFVFFVTIACVILVIYLIMSGFFTAFPPLVNKILIGVLFVLAVFGPLVLIKMSDGKRSGRGHNPQIRSASSIKRPGQNSAYGLTPEGEQYARMLLEQQQREAQNRSHGQGRTK